MEILVIGTQKNGAIAIPKEEIISVEWRENTITISRKNDSEIIIHCSNTQEAKKLLKAYYDGDNIKFLNWDITYRRKEEI